MSVLKRIAAYQKTIPVSMPGMQEPEGVPIRVVPTPRKVELIREAKNLGVDDETPNEEILSQWRGFTVRCMMEAVAIDLAGDDQPGDEILQELYGPEATPEERLEQYRQQQRHEAWDAILSQSNENPEDFEGLAELVEAALKACGFGAQVRAAEAVLAGGAEAEAEAAAEQEDLPTGAEDHIAEVDETIGALPTP